MEKNEGPSTHCTWIYLYVFRSVSAVKEIRVTLFLPEFQSAQIALPRS